MNHSPRQHARAAGILYLVTHVTSVLAVVAYDAGVVRGGVTLEFTLAIGCMGTGVLLWVLLRNHGAARAATFAFLRGVEASVIIAGAMPLLAAAWLDKTDVIATATATELHNAAFLLGQGLVISVNTIVLAWLLRSSRTVPTMLALLGLAGGAVVLLSNLAQLWGLVPRNGTVAAIGAVPVFAFELWFAIHLITVGLDQERSPSSTALRRPAAVED